MYHRYRGDFTRAVFDSSQREVTLVKLRFADRFRTDTEHFVCLPGRKLPSGFDSGNIFACCYQMRRYCTMVYAESISYETAGQRLKVNWRTVKSKVNVDWVDAYRDA